MLKLAGHLRHILRRKFQQHFIGQTGVDADAVKLGDREIAQHALGQRQFAVKLIARLMALFTLHHFGPDAFQIGGIRRQIFFAHTLGGGTNNKSALLVAVIRHDAFQAFALGFAFNTLRDADVRRARHKNQIARRQRDVGGETRAFGAERIFHHLHHEILPLAHQL